MDKLDEIFALQKAYEDDMFARRPKPPFTREEWVSKLTIAIVGELAELNDEVNYKWWKNPKPIDEDAVKEELVDVFHFFLSMCLKLGITSQELYAVYRKKNSENVARQQGRSAKPGYDTTVRDE